MFGLTTFFGVLGTFSFCFFLSLSSFEAIYTVSWTLIVPEAIIFG